MAIKRNLRDHTILISGLLAVSVLIFQSYLNQPPKQLDWLQQGSLIAFAVALPGLALWFLIILSDKSGYPIDFSKINDKVLIIFRTILAVSILAAIVGIGLAIWRLVPLAGFLFLLLSTLYLGIFYLLGNYQGYKIM